MVVPNLLLMLAVVLVVIQQTHPLVDLVNLQLVWSELLRRQQHFFGA